MKYNLDPHRMEHQQVTQTRIHMAIARVRNCQVFRPPCYAWGNTTQYLCKV